MPLSTKMRKSSPLHGFWPLLLCFQPLWWRLIQLLQNVALTNIASGFAISTDDATWILTTYLVANGIILPTTSWFSNMFGRKKFLIICSIVFTFGSLLCGMSTSFSMMLIARIIQGLGGGALFPIAQTMLLESFPHSKRVQLWLYLELQLWLLL